MKITDFLVCDSIRHEVHDQVSIIGVYMDGIVFHVPPSDKDTWPKQKTICIFMRAAIEDKDITNLIRKIKVFALFKDEKYPLGEIPVNLEKDGAKQRVVLSATLGNFAFKAEGTFSIQLVLINDSSEEIEKIRPLNSLSIREVVQER